MKRRQLFTLMSAGAISMASDSLSQPFSISKSRWKPDGAGHLARIGLLTPDFDPVPESEMCAMIPAGVSIHSSRIQYDRIRAESFAEPPNVDDATESLRSLNPHVILFGFTSSSYFLRIDGEDRLIARLQTASQPTRVILTCRAATEALNVLGAKKIAMIHPPWFPTEVNEKGREYFKSLGFQLIFCEPLRPARKFTEVAPDEVFQWVTANAPKEADVIFIAGNGMRVIGAIAALEQTLNKPILTANQVLLWAGLRSAGVNADIGNYGRIFSMKRR